MFEDILDDIGLVYDVYEELESDIDDVIYNIVDSIFDDSEDDYV